MMTLKNRAIFIAFLLAQLPLGTVVQSMEAMNLEPYKGKRILNVTPLPSESEFEASLPLFPYLASLSPEKKERMSGLIDSSINRLIKDNLEAFDNKAPIPSYKAQLDYRNHSVPHVIKFYGETKIYIQRLQEKFYKDINNIYEKRQDLPDCKEKIKIYLKESPLLKQQTIYKDMYRFEGILPLFMLKYSIFKLNTSLLKEFSKEISQEFSENIPKDMDDLIFTALLLAAHSKADQKAVSKTRVRKPKRPIRPDTVWGCH